MNFSIMHTLFDMNHLQIISTQLEVLETLCLMCEEKEEISKGLSF